MTIPINPTDFLTEPEVLERWRTLTPRELKRARKANPPQISFYDFPRAQGGPCYTPAQVQEYIDRVYLKACPCQNVETLSPPTAPENDSKSGNTTSTPHIPLAAASGTHAGMTPALARSAAEALAHQMSRPQRSRSPRSSHPPRRVRGKDHLALVKS
jgi:hypothetical protein